MVKKIEEKALARVYLLWREGRRGSEWGQALEELVSVASLSTLSSKPSSRARLSWLEHAERAGVNS